VREFGARPNDAGDDTIAIQAAIDAASAAGDAVVSLPAGVYLIRASTGRNFTGLLLKARVSLVGDGADTTVLKLIPETVDPAWKSIRLLLVEGDTRVADLAFDGSRVEMDSATLTISQQFCCVRAQAWRTSSRSACICMTPSRASARASPCP